MLSRPEGDYTGGTGKARMVTAALTAYAERTGQTRDPPSNLEWAALRTLAGCKPVIVPTRRGGAWLYIERLSPSVYEVRMIAPSSALRGRARLVSLAELSAIIQKARAKGRAAVNPKPP